MPRLFFAIAVLYSLVMAAVPLLPEVARIPPLQILIRILLFGAQLASDSPGLVSFVEGIVLARGRESHQKRLFSCTFA